MARVKMSSKEREWLKAHNEAMARFAEFSKRFYIQGGQEYCNVHHIAVRMTNAGYVCWMCRDNATLHS